MSKGRDRTVFRREDGMWANKRNDADKTSSLHDTQREANKAAAEMLRNQGGGERTTMGIHGRIVRACEKITFRPLASWGPCRSIEWPEKAINFRFVHRSAGELTGF